MPTISRKFDSYKVTYESFGAGQADRRSSTQWLVDAQRVVGFLAERLRVEAPERSWGF